LPFSIIGGDKEKSEGDKVRIKRILNNNSVISTKGNKKLNDSIYIHLTDDIHFAIERYKNYLPIKNGLIWETRQLYKNVLIK
jgi:transcriptional antiterminator